MSVARPTVDRVPTLEEITYEAGRSALADQESVVAGARQRTGSQLAAHALVAPWKLKFAIDASDLYRELYEQAATEAEADTLGWLAAAGFGYQQLRAENATKVQRMSWLSGLLGVLMVAQTIAWITALAIH
jgi:hypothetical protein